MTRKGSSKFPLALFSDPVSAIMNELAREEALRIWNGTPEIADIPIWLDCDTGAFVRVLAPPSANLTDVDSEAWFTPWLATPKC